MTAPFDYTELFKGAFAAMREETPGNRIAPAAAYLRTRIEAAFVPVDASRELHLGLIRVGDRCAAAEARAEAAEARNKVLVEALRKAHDKLHECTAVLTATDCADVAKCMADLRQALGGEHER